MFDMGWPTQMAFEDLVPTAVNLPNSVVLNYVREGNGRPLIFIHGAMGDWRAWGQQWTVFSQAFDCISYSRRYSYPNPNRMASPDHNALVDAEDLRLFMAELGLSSAILVGSSYGGFTALALATTAPDLVDAVVAVEPPMMKYASMDDDGAAVAAAFRQATIVPARDAFERGDDLDGTLILTTGIVARDGKSATPPAHIMKSTAAKCLGRADAGAFKR